jgi:hypothetical protein
MTDYTITNGAAGIPAGEKAYIAEVVLDFSTTNLTTSDSVQAFEIPANTLVLGGGIVVTTADATSTTLDFGDGSAATYLVSALDSTGTNQEFHMAPKFYASADTLDVTANTTTFDGVIRVFAIMAPIGAAPSDAAFA